ncbi:winged helix-turn-helix domain-containing protein [Devosia sp. A449]
MKILIVEADPDFADSLRAACAQLGYTIQACGNAVDAKLHMQEQPPDLVVLAWSLPDTPGIELCRQIRARRGGQTLPVIMISERTDEAARVRCLETGADVVLTKPISMAELRANIRAVVRRYRPSLMSDTLRSQGLELNRLTHRVQCMGNELKVSSTEFRLLMKLMENSGKTLSRNSLLDQVWGTDAFVSERTVDVHIARIRNILKGTTAGDAIQTIRGAGYIFQPAVATEV